MRAVLAGALLLTLAPATAAPKSQSVSILPGGDSRQPISIEADKLDYFQKEGKAVYNGHVVVVQGDTRLTCSKLSLLIDISQPTAGATPEPAKAEAAPGADSSNRLKHMDCAGPVTVATKSQTATGDNGSYDKGRSEVVLTGNVVLTDVRGVTKGDRLIYDLNSGQASVQGGGSHRVTGMFSPGGGDPTPGAKAGAAKKK